MGPITSAVPAQDVPPRLPLSHRVLPNPEERPTVPVWANGDEPSAARALGLSKNAAYEAAARGDFPTLRLGRKLVAPTAALRRLLGLDAVG